MSRRNIYVVGGLAVLAGVVLIAFAIASLDSDGGNSPTAGTEADTTSQPPSGTVPDPGTPGEQGRQEAAVEARGREVGQQLSRRRPVRAPDLSAELIHDGSLPQELKPRFERATAAGALVLSKLRGTPVVLHLWSSQCVPCRASQRLVEATWERWGPRGILFVGVLVDEARASTAKAVIDQYDVTYPAILDRSGIAEHYGATALPQTFFISAAGAIVGQVVGSPSVRQLEVGTAASRSSEPFGSEQGSARVPLR